MGYSPSRIKKVRALEKVVSSMTGKTLIGYIESRFNGSTFEDSAVDKGHLFSILCSEDMSGMSASEHRFLQERLGTSGLAFYSGKRTVEQYAFDLVSGWIVEDLLKARLIEYGYEVKTLGDDKEREFLKAPSASADWLVDGVSAECFVDFLGTWLKQEYMDVKPGKMQRLKTGEMVMYCYDLPSDTFVSVGADEILAVCDGKIPTPIMHPQWKKETYQIPWKPMRFKRVHPRKPKSK